jgi:hypothetical protein
MIITYLRSSSYGTHSMCEQQYFIEYVLGHRSPSNKKADKGTIVHKVLEILAYVKLNIQNNQTKFIDDVFGEVDVNNYNLNTIIEKVYKYYTSSFTHHEWDVKDYKDCHNWVYKALSYNDGMFDPRHRTILQPEQHFDLEIRKPWAYYKYETADGPLEGYLAIKGTIDLITAVSNDTIEIIDWKTGRRLDWATGQEKTLEKLHNDPQLRIYHYAISNLYPHMEHCIVSINFINDGGAYSVCFDKSDLDKTEDMIRKKFEVIKSSQRPQLSKTWKCNKLCHFGKSTFENTSLLPILEYRDNQTCNKDTFMTKCEQIKHDIDLKGIKRVVDEYTVKGYSVGKYKAPGSTE